MMDLVDFYPEDYEYYYYNEEEDSEYDNEEEEEAESGRRWDDGFSQGTYCGFVPSFLARHYAQQPRPYLTQEEADRNARELMEEEEREKEKANKKRLKKKRQKERRRQQKLQETPGGGGPPPDNNNNGEEEPEQPISSASGSEDDLDLGSSFVRKAQKKMESKPKPERRERPKERATGRSQERPPPLNAAPRPRPQNHDIKVHVSDRCKIQESMGLAGMGNNLANQNRFAESLHFYSEAIKMNPSEFRFLGNRAYIYERLGRYGESLADAERALELRPDFLKGFFRKGKALKGLKRYSEAIAAFQSVILCDANHVEAAQEIAQCQEKLQESMAVTRVKILSSAPLSPPPTPSPPGPNEKVFVSRNIYNTNSAIARNLPPSSGKPVTAVMQSKFFPIWVGNVTNKITEEILRTVFEPFGSLHSVRTLHSRTCAFINFTDREAAEAAHSALQGLQIEGSTLVLQLRNPEHSATRKK